MLLYRQEIRAQKAWALALAEGGYLTTDEAKKLSKCLDTAQKLIESEEFEWSITDEDIHMNLERFMTEQLGELGKKHPELNGRSMYVRKTKPLPVECVVRGYLAGSGWKEYQRYASFYC